MIVKVIFLSLAGLLSATAQDYCSLKVQVVDPSGNNLSGIRVTVEEKAGRVTTGHTEKGEVRFCDLGLSGVIITVGLEGSCDLVTMRNVPLLWGITHTVKAIINPCPKNIGNEEIPPSPCAALLRFANDDGDWIPSVGFSPPGSPKLQSDQYGRIMFHAALGKSIHLLTQKDGYLPKAIDLNCSRDLMWQEQIVVLKKTP